MKDIHRGNILARGGGKYDELRGVTNIFECPEKDCEYARVHDSDEGIRLIRDNHNAAVHPSKHIPVMMEDAKERENEYYSTLAERVRTRQLPTGGFGKVVKK